MRQFARDSAPVVPARSDQTVRHLVTALAWIALAVIAPAAPVAAGLPTAAEDEPLPSLAPMIERVTPAVVNIATTGTVRVRQNPLLSDPFFRRFFNVPDQPLERRTESLGSGVVIDAQRGLVVTNNHVIANADKIAVKLSDGRVLEAKLVGTDPETDIAVIRIPSEGLRALTLVDSDRLRVGDFVVAIGNPFGLNQTVTSGIVSALARSGLGITGYEDYIQTDASINPGNSGGALVNLRGELVGINTAIFSQTGGNIGIGFAIPSNVVREVTEQLVARGAVQRGFIGAQMQDLDPGLADAFGLRGRGGAVLSGVTPGSPAARSGLKEGDVIVTVNGKPVAGANEVRNAVGLVPVGQSLNLGIVRNGKDRSVKVTVAPRDAGDSAGGAASVRNPRLAGATFGEIPDNYPFYGQIPGVFVFGVEPGSQAWRAGLREQDVVTEVNRAPVAGLDDFLAAVNANPNDSLLLRIQRGAAAAYMVLK